MFSSRIKLLSTAYVWTAIAVLVVFGAALPGMLWLAAAYWWCYTLSAKLLTGMVVFGLAGGIVYASRTLARWAVPAARASLTERVERADAPFPHSHRAEV